MASAAQIAANRRNSQKSTGPRTRAGKNRSKLNGLKHGLRVKEPVMPAPYMRVAVEKYRKAALARGLEVPRGLETLLMMAVEVLGLTPQVAGGGGTTITPPELQIAKMCATRPTEPIESPSEGPMWVHVATTQRIDAA